MPNLFETAKRLAQLVEDRSLEMQVPITLSVVDAHGNLVLKHRMSGAPLISVEMSEPKAYTSALLDIATQDNTPVAPPGQPTPSLPSVAAATAVAVGAGVA